MDSFFSFLSPYLQVESKEVFTTKDAKSAKERIDLTAKNAKDEKYFFMSFVLFVVSKATN
ncbi:MAG: hypothetical protein ACRDFW_05915 [bacterium]